MSAPSVAAVSKYGVALKMHALLVHEQINVVRLSDQMCEQYRGKPVWYALDVNVIPHRAT